MIRRVERSPQGARPRRGILPTPRWRTFHAIGEAAARHAALIGLDPSFHHPRPRGFATAQLVRHELGFPARRALSQKATCLAIYSRVVNAQAELDAV